MSRVDTPPDGNRSAIGKVVAVVEALEHEDRLSQIAQTAGLPISTVHRILRELAALGWVRVDEGGGYRIGARLLGFVGQASEESYLLPTARPRLLELRDQTGHTVHFAMRHGDKAVYVDKLDGLRAYQMRSRIGHSVPLHSTAIGKSILAWLPEEELRAIVARTGLPARTNRTITELPVLLQHLALVRRRGFAVDLEENEADVRCIGAPVVDHRGIPIAGLSISSLAFELGPAQIEKLAPLVVRAAADISSMLGARLKPTRISRSATSAAASDSTSTPGSTTSLTGTP